VNIIVVEDEPFIALDIETAIEALHHRVVGVADSKSSAIALARNTRCDAALIDIRLRDGFTGMDIAAIFREEFGIPFAFVTGNAEQVDPDRFHAVDVVPKPFNESQLAAVLTRFETVAANRPK